MMGLLALLAIAIPIAIHVLTRSQGKVVHFPFLALLPKQTASTELHVKLRKKRLLAVRLLLILCACAILNIDLLSDWWSQAQFSKSFATKAPNPTLIVTQDWWLNSSKQDKSTLKEQLEIGIFKDIEAVIIVAPNGNNATTLRYVDKNTFFNLALNDSAYFGAQQSDKTLPIDPSSSNNINAHLNNIWSIAQAIATTIPADSSLHIFTSNRQAQFVGEPSSVRQPVKWHIAAIAQNTFTPRLKVALITVDEKRANTEQIYSMAQTQLAIESLKEVYPAIDITLLKNESRLSLDAIAQEYDAVLIESIDNSKSANTRNIIQVKNLSSPSKKEFVIDLAKAIFSTKQQEYFINNAWLSNEHIESGGASPSSVNISDLPKVQTDQWKTFLAILLLMLFTVERFMSEQGRKINTVSSMNMADR